MLTVTGVPDSPNHVLTVAGVPDSLKHMLTVTGVPDSPKCMLTVAGDLVRSVCSMSGILWQLFLEG